MKLAPERRRELKAILALATGAFVGLSLWPATLTGPLGTAFGATLWKILGIGSLLIPALLLTMGLSGLGWIRPLSSRRAAVLFGGLALLVPFWVGITVGLEAVSDLPPDHQDWPTRYKAVGLLAAFLVVSIVRIIGTAGAVIAGLLGLSALTLSTVGWHPFRRHNGSPLRFGLRRKKRVERAFFKEEAAPPPAKRPPDPTGTVPKKPAKESIAKGSSGSEEQAFISKAAAKPFPADLLDDPQQFSASDNEAELDRLGHVLIDTLKTFKVDARLGTHRSTGPVVTQFEVAPAAGVKVGRIAALADDLALKMEAQSIRIVAPIPGKAYVGVEVPNPKARMVVLSELLNPSHWDPRRPGLPIALGIDLEGKPVTADLAKMPHLLIAGATGSGKSVCVNTIITSLIHRYDDQQLRLIMIDPKMVELTIYNSLPHMRHRVVTDNKDAAMALKWAMYEMEERYALFSVNNVRNLHEFNRKVKEGRKVVMPCTETETLDGRRRTANSGVSPTVPYDGSTLPFVVVIVEELADLMMTVQAEVEKPLAILAQKARATGIHLILATQRPSVNVITGLIKANFPCRIAFRVASKVDSRTILDQNGAETLLGNGDMLFLPPGKSEPVRLQGAYIDTSESERITQWYDEQLARRSGAAAPEEDIIASVAAREAREEAGPEAGDEPSDRDPLFREAAEVCLQNGGGSTSLLQRKLRIGYGRAARVVDQLHSAGILGPADGSKARDVLVGGEQLDEYCR